MTMDFEQKIIVGIVAVFVIGVLLFCVFSCAWTYYLIAYNPNVEDAINFGRANLGDNAVVVVGSGYDALFESRVMFELDGEYYNVTCAQGLMAKEVSCEFYDTQPYERK